MTGPTAATGDESNGQSTGSLFSQVIAQIGALLRREIDYARAEVSENIDKAVLGLGLVVAGLVLALSALNVLAGALVAELVTLGLQPVWAALIVGVALTVIALLLVTAGARAIKACSLAPKRIAKNVREDAQVLKEKLK